MEGKKIENDSRVECLFFKHTRLQNKNLFTDVIIFSVSRCYEDANAIPGPRLAQTPFTIQRIKSSVRKTLWFDKRSSL